MLPPSELREKGSVECSRGEKGGHERETNEDIVATTNTEVEKTEYKVRGGGPLNPGPMTGDAPCQERVSLRTLRHIFDRVTARGTYNYRGARVPVPSRLKMTKWRQCLVDYHDKELPDFLEYGWPINFDRESALRSTLVNHASATQYPADITFYIDTEMAHGALAGPFEGPPVDPTHISPLMTKPKKDAKHRRVIMDLSWPPGQAINDGVSEGRYIDGPMDIRLPTVEYMEHRLLQLGAGAYMYKTDLARGYRQLRVDPADWPLLGFMHDDRIYMDLCPPFGLRTSALFMQRTSEAICYIHGKRGYLSRAYLDDFGGAENREERATKALDTLQIVMGELGIQEALHKVCRPAKVMVWLGIIFDWEKMTMAIPEEKMAEIMTILDDWSTKLRATQREMQSLLGLLQFVASVSPPTRIFTNRMLQDLRETPKRGSESLSLGFKMDVRFFRNLLPHYNGVKIIDKTLVQCQDTLELDACTTGCGAFTGTHYYAEQFPSEVLQQQHPIAHLELLNIVVALKTWADEWAGHRILVFCDNMNSCIAIQSGRTRDQYMQSCVREIFMWSARHDIELIAQHRPGVQMVRADALSRAHTDDKYVRWIEQDSLLSAATRVAVPRDYFKIINDL